MKLTQISYFIAVAEEGSLVRAAARLHISQPPLTRQILLLEEEMGVRLFDRHFAGMRLTEAGQVFLNEFRQISSSIALAVDNTQRAGRGDLGRLDVGMFGTGALGLIPRLIHRFRGLHPGIEVMIYSMSKDRQIQALRDRTIHVAFNRMVTPEPDIVVECVERERLFVALNIDHPLSQESDIDISALKNEKFVLMRPSSVPGLRDGLLSLCFQFGFIPKITQEADDVITCITLVASGLGILLVPESATAVRLPTVVYKELRRLPENARIDLSCFYSTENNSPILQRFLETVRETCASEGLSPTAA